jgi:hypothetical protein
VPHLPNDETPDFSTLSGIMAYFNKVPFETFKKELNDWFARELPNNRPDLIKTNGEFDLPAGFHDLMDKIMKLAEEMDQSRSN